SEKRRHRQPRSKRRRLVSSSRTWTPRSSERGIAVVKVHGSVHHPKDEHTFADWLRSGAFVNFVCLCDAALLFSRWTQSRCFVTTRPPGNLALTTRWRSVLPECPRLGCRCFRP